MTLTAEKLESLITEGEIRKAVSLTRKSPSYDGFPAERYKEILAPVLQKVNDIEMFELVKYCAETGDTEDWMDTEEHLCSSFNQIVSTSRRNKSSSCSL